MTEVFSIVFVFFSHPLHHSSLNSNAERRKRRRTKALLTNGETGSRHSYKYNTLAAPVKILLAGSKERDKQNEKLWSTDSLEY